jgi:UDP-N-acetylmuramoylalanine--D-glutamate ligase
MKNNKIEIIKKELQEKSIAIWGMGKEGTSTLSFFQKHFSDKVIAIFDDNLELDEFKNGKKITILNDRKKLNDYDLIFKGPGISMNNDHIIERKKITSQTDFFIKHFKNKIIGITGTKGKSTTVSLLYHILKEKFDDTVLVGNIGVPCLDLLDEINDNTNIVFELSSHQLEYINSSPHIGVVLNVFEEHLDHYENFEKYREAKMNIFKFQNEKDIAIFNYGLEKYVKTTAHQIRVGSDSSEITIDNNIFTFSNEKYCIDKESTSLIGNHNIYNISIVFYILKNHFNFSSKEMLDSLKRFQPLPHRLEYVGKYNGIHFYDDSISTICETTMEAIKSLENIGTLILGGFDRRINYEPLAKFVSKTNVDNVILIPDTNVKLEKLFGTINHNINIKFAKNLKDAVALSKKITKKEKVCLLSPAASSYNEFKNFAERGDKFKEYVIED